MGQIERNIAARLTDAGYTVHVNGWPDLLVERDGKLVAYEVKAPGDTLRPHQERVHEALRAAGITVEVIDDQANLWLGPSPYKRRVRPYLRRAA